MNLVCKHMPMLKDLVIKRDKEAIQVVQNECREEGDFSGISILECFKETKNEIYLYDFFVHCGYTLERACSVIEFVLPRSYFSRVRS